MAVLPFPIPPALLRFAGRGPQVVRWLDALPALVGEVVAEWELACDGAPMHGYGALVVPVRTPAGRPAVLKLCLPHDEARHEHLGLTAWRGRGAVELFRADPRRWALLLERLHADEDLTSIGDIEACEIAAAFFTRLHIPALPQLVRLSTYVDRWTSDLVTLPKDGPLPRRLVEQAVTLGKSFVGDRATDAVMIHGDLHYANVLAAEREPWLVIDPKPMAGDPHYEVAPLLWNRWGEVVRSGDVRSAVRRRFHTVVDTAGLDEDRARDWIVIREMHNALWAVQDAEREARGLTSEDREWITIAVTIAKAVQD